MASRSETPHFNVATPAIASRTPERSGPVLARVRRVTASIIAWLRAGYPGEAPGTGYSPLIALVGPIALTHGQTTRVVNEFRGDDAYALDIGVAITKVTDRLPTEHQIRTVARALHDRHRGINRTLRHP